LPKGLLVLPSEVKFKPSQGTRKERITICKVEFRQP
jgi:hypothetical protein